MAATRGRPIALGRGGVSWHGWSFGPYGKAREFRLIDPDGTTYTAGEIQALARVAVELDYLRGELHAHQLEAGKVGLRLSADELRMIGAAVSILARALPTRASGRGQGANVYRLPGAL